VVKIFELAGDARTHLADLTGHDGPVRAAAARQRPPQRA
jgi:hypothetical protein